MKKNDIKPIKKKKRKRATTRGAKRVAVKKTVSLPVEPVIEESPIGPTDYELTWIPRGEAPKTEGWPQ